MKKKKKKKLFLRCFSCKGIFQICSLANPKTKLMNGNSKEINHNNVSSSSKPQEIPNENIIKSQNQKFSISLLTKLSSILKKVNSDENNNNDDSILKSTVSIETIEPLLESLIKSGQNSEVFDFLIYPDIIQSER